MKIVFVCPPGAEKNVDFLSGESVGAIQLQIFGLCRGLAEKGHEVYLIRRWSLSKELLENHYGINFMNIKQTSPFSKWTKREDTMPFVEAFLSFIMYFLFSVKVLRTLRMIKPDIVNVSSLLQAFFMFSFIKSVKVYITHSHDIYIHDTPYVTIKKFMLKHALSNSDSIVALTYSIKYYLEALRFKIDAVIPNAIDPSEYTSKNNDYILYSGRLVKHKRVMDLLKSFSSLQKFFSTKLIVAGEGPEKKALIAWVNREGAQNSIAFMPYLSREEYRHSLSNCSVFVLPSTTEAFGVVIIEAMASGKPVIARRVQGPIDIITHGYDGFLFSDSSELTKYLELLLSDRHLRAQIGSNARKTVLEKYSINEIVSEYEKLYESLLLTR